MGATDQMMHLPKESVTRGFMCVHIRVCEGGGFKVHICVKINKLFMFLFYVCFYVWNRGQSLLL